MRIRQVEVEANAVMVSFGVISLFTSIPPALAIDTIDDFLLENYDETDLQLKRAHIIELLELCLKAFFIFNDQIYVQKKGIPMGSPLSKLIAQAELQRLEKLVFSSYTPKFWARYVDDTFVATTIFAADEDIQEGQLIVFLLLHRKLDVREEGVELFFERQHLIPFDDDEGVIHIPSPTVEGPPRL
nr:unnamed protein product [Spirometra erinaceieuropaei]